MEQRRPPEALLESLVMGHARPALVGRDPGAPTHMYLDHAEHVAASHPLLETPTFMCPPSYLGDGG